MPQPVRLRATVEDVIDHAAGLRSLILRPERKVPRFLPGQFLHFALDHWDPSCHWPDSRPFSIASPPEQRDRLRVTVSKVGPFTTRLMDTEPGDEGWIKLPYGEFVVANRSGTPAVLVAGGTGVAPFASLITSVSPIEMPVTLLYGARRPDLLIYREAVEMASERQPLLSWKAFLESGEIEGSIPGPLSTDAVLEAVSTVGRDVDPLIYLSGPPSMIESLTTGLCEHGVARERIRVDAWA